MAINVNEFEQFVPDPPLQKPEKGKTIMAGGGQENGRGRRYGWHGNVRGKGMAMGMRGGETMQMGGKDAGGAPRAATIGGGKHRQGARIASTPRKTPT